MSQSTYSGKGIFALRAPSAPNYSGKGFTQADFEEILEKIRNTPPPPAPKLNFFPQEDGSYIAQWDGYFSQFRVSKEEYDKLFPAVAAHGMARNG